MKTVYQKQFFQKYMPGTLYRRRTMLQALIYMHYTNFIRIEILNMIFKQNFHWQ